MALSGTFGTNIATYFRLQVEWSATQNIAANSSTITMKVYWLSLNSASTISSSTTKTGSTTMLGFSESFTATAGLSGNQKKLIETRTYTTAHNSDGTKQISLGASFDIEVTLGGVYRGTVSTSSGVIDLNTIPRASSIASSIDYTPYGNLPVSINRASSNFLHTLKVYIGSNEEYLKELTGVGANATIIFSVSDITRMLEKLGTSSSMPIKITTATYNGSTLIGTTSKTGTISAPSRNTLINQPKTITLGDTAELNIQRRENTTTSIFFLPFGGSNITIAEKTTATTVEFDTGAHITELQALIGAESNSVSGRWRVITYYNNVQVGDVYSPQPEYVAELLLPSDANPTFTAEGLSYVASLSGITGSNQYAIQNKSTITVSLPEAGLATGNNGATIQRYDFILGGVQKSINHTGAAIDVVFNPINASTDQTLTVRAVDSRGLSTERSIPVKMVAFAPNPSYTTVSAVRANGFENLTTLNFSGLVPSLLVNGVEKNTAVSLKYQFKESTSTTSWGALPVHSFAKSGTGRSFIGMASLPSTPVVLDLDNTKAWQVRFIVEDYLGTYERALTVSVGTPLLFIDKDKKSVGLGMFPNKNNALQVNGVLEGTEVAANKWTINSAGHLQKLTGNHLELSADNNLNIKSPSNVSITAARIGLNGKTASGHNFTSILGDSSNSHYLIQTKEVFISLSGAKSTSVPVVWDTSFDEAPIMVQATPYNANSFNYLPAVYSATTSGCTVWVQNIHDVGQQVSIRVHLMAIGKKS